MPTYVVKLTLDSDAKALVANQANVADSPAPVWATALPGGEIFTTQCGMCLGGGKLYVAGWVNGGVGTSIHVYQFDNLQNGHLQGGQVPMLTISEVPATNADDWIAWAQGTLLLGYKGGDLDFYNTVNNSYIARLKGTNQFDILDIATDGQGRFYVLSSGAGVRIFDATGNTLVDVPHLGSANAMSICFEPISGHVVIGYSSGNYDLSIHDGTTLAQLAIGQSDLPSGVIGVRADGAGGFLLTGKSGGAITARRISSISPYTVVASNTYASVPQTPRFFSTYLAGADSTPSGASKSRVRGIAVAGGTVVRFSTKGPQGLTNGPNALNPGVPCVFSSYLLGKLFFADGLNFKYYDADSDTVKTLTASTGSLPRDSSSNAPRLCAAWRNRLVLSGLPQDPNNWFMAAVDDPTNWNYGVDVPVETQAVSGNESTAGLCPQPITSLIAYNDELLLMGGITNIYQMTGDPAAGGRIDLVTDEVGMAWGRAFCKNPQGILYFFSNQGSIYRIVPGSIPERISDNITYDLANVDLNTKVCRMAWDERQRGFHVWLTPTAGGATFHYFYDALHEAWWKDQYANALHNPLCCTPFDGDLLSDRCILIGSFDGYIRQVDYQALDDDGTPIASYVFLGPVKQKQGGGFYLADLQVSLDLNSGRAMWDVYAGADSQTALAGLSHASGQSVGGRNRSVALRTFGHAQYVRLSSLDQVASGWRLEYVRARLRVPDGKARQRTF